MYSTSSGPIEFAMTHLASGERSQRPAEVRAICERLQRWVAGPEVCKSCQRLPAARFVDARPLCGRCYEQFQQRHRRYDEGLRVPVVRADTDGDVDRDSLEGYAIRFNEKSVELFGFFEYIRPSAADRLMTERPDVRSLWNHNSDETIARYSAGTLRVEKRTAGVFVGIDPPKWASRHVESVDRRDITGQSFGFIALEDDWWLEDGIPQREILDMHVVEVSPVSFPAYPTTTLKVRKAGTRSEVGRDREREHFLRFA